MVVIKLYTAFSRMIFMIPSIITLLQLYCEILNSYPLSYCSYPVNSLIPLRCPLCEFVLATNILIIVVLVSMTEVSFLCAKPRSINGVSLFVVGTLSLGLDLRPHSIFCSSVFFYSFHLDWLNFFVSAFILTCAFLCCFIDI